MSSIVVDIPKDMLWINLVGTKSGALYVMFKASLVDRLVAGFAENQVAMVAILEIDKRLVGGL